MAALRVCGEVEGAYTTVGVHPTRCNEFLTNPDAYIEELIRVGTEGKAAGKVGLACSPSPFVSHTLSHSAQIVAVGEFGLDWDRTQFCAKEVQLPYFEAQFRVVDALRLPLFLHSRSTDGVFLGVYCPGPHLPPSLNALM